MKEKEKRCGVWTLYVCARCGVLVDVDSSPDDPRHPIPLCWSEDAVPPLFNARAIEVAPASQLSEAVEALREADQCLALAQFAAPTRSSAVSEAREHLRTALANLNPDKEQER